MGAALSPAPPGSGGPAGPAGPAGTAGPAAARLLFVVADRCDALARLWLSVATLAMAGLLTAQVIFRYAFNHSLFWSEELGRALLVQLTFIGASVAWRGRAHIGMDALVARLSPQWAWRARLLVLCVCCAFFGAVAWHGARFTLFLLPQQTAALGVSRAVVFAAVPVGGALLTLHALADLLSHLWPGAASSEGCGVPRGDSPLAAGGTQNAGIESSLRGDRGARLAAAPPFGATAADTTTPEGR
ncbi:TRAP transporter small permease [Nitratidesulfovibrio sp. HK-II]|uniref:TRAP transporter small permease n=1 Tax=Nitratidesulfovibrio sp. HK-II TaxID=2009266 RepID=UPI000E2F1739|nr:TRAP transporter small permease [Nitratidesulfovibrio sp. HK-II]GBO97371.1 TRAP-type transport system [Nitratidesulfovibrio sp. HK-II]